MDFLGMSDKQAYTLATVLTKPVLSVRVQSWSDSNNARIMKLKSGHIISVPLDAFCNGGLFFHAGKKMLYIPIKSELYSEIVERAIATVVGQLDDE